MAKTSVDQEFLEFVIKSIVDHPNDVKVTRAVDEMGVLLNLKVNPEDMGKIIGREGSTAKAIRTILRVIGSKNNARINLKIEEPEGGRVTRTRETAATSEEKDDVGATAHVTYDVTAGVKAEGDVEITEYIRNERATWRSTKGKVTAIGSSTLKPTDTGTKLTFLIDIALPYSILGKIIDKLLVTKETEQNIEKGLQNLKSILEE